MITVGYGDITPQNYCETNFVSGVMVLACGIFGYSLNQIGTIFNDIFKYQEFYWKENKEEEQQKQLEIKSILSQQLQLELVWDENKLILRDARILVDNFSKEAMRKTAKKGSCEIFIEGNDKKQTLYEIQSGQNFGTSNFFTGLNRSCSVRSQGFSTLLFINRDDFIEICKQSAPGFEKFCYLRDKVLYENELSFINSQCHQSHRQLLECQFLHFNNKTHFLNQLTESEKIIQLKRRKIQSNKTPILIKLCTTQKFHKLFLRENQSLLQEYESNNFFLLIADMYDSEDYEEDDSMILLNEESLFFTEKQQEYQKSQSHNILSDNHISKNNININQFTAAEPNHMQTQSSHRGTFDSFLSNKFRQGEESQVQKRKSSNEATIDQKSMPVISTILVVNNSNITNNNQNYSFTKFVKSNIQPGESNYVDRSSITLSRPEIRKDRLNNLDQNDSQVYQSLNSLVSKSQQDKLIKESSQSSSQIQKLLPSKQSYQIFTTQSKPSGTNVLTTLLRVKNMTKKQKIDLKKQKKIYHNKINKASAINKLSTQKQKHRNIVSYSTKQQILDERFEKMQDFTHYYPLRNSQISIKTTILLVMQIALVDQETNSRKSRQNSVNTFNKFNNFDADDSKSQTKNEILKDIDGDSYSKILNQNNHQNLHLKQHFSQIVNHNPKCRKTTAKCKSSVYQLRIPYFHHQLINIKLRITFPYIQTNSFKLNILKQSSSSKSWTQKKTQVISKQKYQITTIKEIEQQINDMDIDTNSFSIIPDFQNSFNITIPNLSVNNSQFKEQQKENENLI
ncbi:hypothetical protein ABPG72_000585 [Tetrahymena utriculariae]